MLGYDQPGDSHVHGVALDADPVRARSSSAQQSANSPHLGPEQPPKTQDVESESRCKSRKFEIHRTAPRPFQSVGRRFEPDGAPLAFVLVRGLRVQPPAFRECIQRELKGTSMAHKGVRCLVVRPTFSSARRNADIAPDSFERSGCDERLHIQTAHRAPPKPSRQRGSPPHLPSILVSQSRRGRRHPTQPVQNLGAQPECRRSTCGLQVERPNVKVVSTPGNLPRDRRHGQGRVGAAWRLPGWSCSPRCRR